MDRDSDILKRYTAASLRELVIIALFMFVFYLLSIRFDLFERLMQFCLKHEEQEFDEIIILLNFVFLTALVFSWRRWLDIRKLGKNLVTRNLELQEALRQIKLLQGVLPICSNCKRIRDDKNEWHQIEEYMSLHSEAEFSHGLCPDCARKLYPRLYGEKTGDQL